MRTVYFESAVRFDDPNLRWGEPSYLLEPGDPGYVADPTSASFPASQPKTRRKQMPKSDPIKSPELLFSQQLQTFKNNIGTYATTLGVTPAEVTAQAADANRYAWELAVQEICRACAEQWSKWKDITRNGGTAPAAGAPAAITLPAPEPPAVAPGVEPRFRALAQKCKKSPNYNTGIGEVLDIEGEVLSGPNLDTLKPQLKPKLSGGNVMVGWGWLGFSQFLDSLEIVVDRGTGAGEVLLTIDTTPDYLDTAPMPSAPAKWTYRAIFRQGDSRVGQWSDPVSINVG